MPIWELRPIDHDSADWRASKYKGRVVIRAPSEDRARDLAGSRFHDMSRRIPGGDTPLSPWRQPDLVACTRLNDSGYDESGPEEILDPKS